MSDRNPFEGIEGRGTSSYLFRNTQQELVALSSQADLKANIVITSSALLSTIAASRLEDEATRVGAAILLIGCLVALMSAVLAVIPTAVMRNRKSTNNPLFFVDAADMTYDEFEQQLAEAVRDDAEVYRMQARDLHQMSTYLAKSKYRRLRLAYIFLLFAVVIAGVVQLVSSFVR